MELVEKHLFYSLLFFSRLNNDTDVKNIFIVLDGEEGGEQYKKINSNYKVGRADRTEVYTHLSTFLFLVNYFDKVKIIKNRYREADEVIAYLALNSKKDYLIYSGDKDMLQLYSENVKIADDYKKGKFNILTKQDVFNKFKNSKKESFTRISENIEDIVKYRVFKGDSSDNIKPPIPRLQDKYIKEILNEYWVENYLDDKLLADIIIKMSNIKLRDKIVGSFSEILNNYKIMDLKKCKDDFRCKKETKIIKIAKKEDKIKQLVKKYNLNFMENLT